MVSATAGEEMVNCALTVDPITSRAVKTGFSVQPVTGLLKPVSNRFTVL